MTSKFQGIQTDAAPKAVGPYSQGIKVQSSTELIFVSGQIPLDPETGKVVDGDIRTLTHSVIDNIEGVLKESEASLTNVIRVEIFLTDMNDFSAVNEEYGKRFVGDPLPARQAVQVAALPLGVPIEISCIATIIPKR